MSILPQAVRQDREATAALLLATLSQERGPLAGF
jgi:hypothetical protein